MKMTATRQEQWFERLPEVGQWATDIAEQIAVQRKELDREMKRLADAIEYRIKRIEELSAAASLRAAANFTQDEICHVGQQHGFGNHPFNAFKRSE